MILKAKQLLPASSGACQLKNKVFTLFFFKWKSEGYRFKRYKKIRLKQHSMVPSALCEPDRSL